MSSAPSSAPASSRVVIAMLRSCAGISADVLAQQERAFASLFDTPSPVGEAVELHQLFDALVAGGVDADSAHAVVLLVDSRAQDLGRPVILPAPTAELSPSKKRDLLASITPAFERELAQPQEQDFVGDFTPIVDPRDLDLATSMKRTATLLILRGRSIGRSYKLDGNRCLIGRATSADIIVDDEGISRFHAVITRESLEPATLPDAKQPGDTNNDDGRDVDSAVSEAGCFHIEDLGSKNGVIVNGFKIADHTLKDGDRIQLGATMLLKFSYQDDVEEEFQQELYKNVTIDPLTGIYNRRHLIERLRAECAYASRQRVPLSLLMIDIDHFKRINDTHGHLAGDAVLRATSAAIQQSLRSEDVFGRYGGEELIVLLRGIEPANALKAGTRIVELVRALVVIHKGAEIHTTVSVGAATTTPALDTPQELLAAADRALYRAKDLGRDRCES